MKNIIVLCAIVAMIGGSLPLLDGEQYIAEKNGPEIFMPWAIGNVDTQGDWWHYICSQRVPTHYFRRTESGMIGIVEYDWSLPYGGNLDPRMP